MRNTSPRHCFVFLGVVGFEPFGRYGLANTLTTWLDLEREKKKKKFYRTRKREEASSILKYMYKKFERKPPLIFLPDGFRKKKIPHDINILIKPDRAAASSILMRDIK